MAKLSQTVYEDPRGEFRTANQLADDAAEAVRGINHITGDDGSLRYPSHVYTLLADLSRLDHYQDQALRQIDAIMIDWLEAGNISVTTGDFEGRPELAVADMSLLLEEARTHAKHLGELLGKAQSAIAYASWSGPDLGED